MKKSHLIIAIWLVAAVFARPASAQFGLFVQSVTNSASYLSPIAQGSIVVILRANLGPPQLQEASSYPLLTQLAGTSVKIAVGGTSALCPMFYSSAYAVSAIIPSSIPVGPAILSVTYGGRTSNSFQIAVGSNAFGIYTSDSSGAGPGAITGLDGAVKTFSAPAHASSSPELRLSCCSDRPRPCAPRRVASPSARTSSLCPWSAPRRAPVA